MYAFIFGMEEAYRIMFIIGSDKCFSENFQQRKVPFICLQSFDLVFLQSCTHFPVSPYSLYENYLLYRTS